MASTYFEQTENVDEALQLAVVIKARRFAYLR